METGAIFGAGRDGGTHGFGQCGTVRGQFIEERPGTEGENAAVPSIAAIGKEADRALEIRLFDELGHRKAAAAGNGIAALQVAKAGLRRCGGNAERNEPALPRQRGGFARGGLEGSDIADVVIAGADQHDRIFGQAQRGERDGGGGVLALGLDDHRAAGRIRQLRFDMIQMGRAGDDDRRPEAGLGRAAQHGGLTQRGIAHQRQERLGAGLARARPEACAAAATQNYGNDRVHRVPAS